MIRKKAKLPARIIQPGLHNKQALRAAFEPAEGVATNEVGLAVQAQPSPRLA